MTLRTNLSLAGLAVFSIALMGGCGTDKGAERHEPSVAATPRSYDSAADVAAGQAAFKANNLDLAYLLLSRAFRGDPGNPACVESLVDTLVVQSRQSQDHGDQVKAYEQLGTANKVVAQATRISVEDCRPAQQVARLVCSQKTIDVALQRLSEDTVTLAKQHIAEAETKAEDAYHWYRPNNRSGVREALVALRWVKERFELADADTRGEYLRVLSILKGMVADKEWASLQAEAGFVENAA